ncbi:bifunctional UDP-N-acetylmuramoyl-tripeptide:D-alanyl-D-alanine ligase/alanine racemase [Marinoscillum sp.]|uniref:bifunctional UDP-N-acetylmuramoyl-tripeptide:D-alanyl-D-alanine ligase/alanine racemase n=1 Tax=Marinoscillum sp. TaxID=2024838 RepID=UPI003BAB2548
MLISELASILPAEFIGQSHDHEVDTLVYDSRRASSSTRELFIALPGTHHDGHDFIPSLYQLGVRNFLVSRQIKAENYPEATFLVVKDTLVALQSLATHHRKQFDLPVVGITGSNGKTIVKEWLATILEQQWNVVKSPKSYNSQLGVPMSVWNLEKTHEVAVFEAGISKAGEMEALERIIQPTLGIFTNIGNAHASGFQSLKGKVTEKALLFAHCEKIICRLDHTSIVEQLRNLPATLITWGINQPDAAINIIPSGSDFDFHYHGAHSTFRIRFVNPFDLENIFHAITAALVLGETNTNIQKAIDKLKPVPMRLELKRGNNNTHILDDSYNNDFMGLSIALDYLRQQPQKLRKTVILSDMLQSGKDPKALYGDINGLLEKHNIDHLIGIGPEMVQNQAVFSMPFDGYLSTNDFLRSVPSFSNETILVKGARDFELERVVHFLEEKNHGTILEVNYESITHNLNVFRQILKPRVKLMVMVKAFAYGVGVEEIAHLLQYHKVDYLGVAYLDEAVTLRRKGITLPIMIMNVDWSSFDLLETFDLEPEIYSLSMLRHFLEVTDNPPPIHLKIETGMNRLGFQVEDLEKLTAMLLQNPQLKVAGIFTHFSSSDAAEEDAFTRKQAAAFDQAYDKLATALGYFPIKHALNSAGIMRWSAFQFDMVRLGIGLYGFDSSGTTNQLKPISTLKTKISQIKPVKQGDSIGYSRMGRADREGKIATIAIGYADGYSRLFGNGNAYVLVNGQKAPTIGNICMDMTMIDVTGLDAKEGDEVIVFGEQPNIRELAKWAQTIPYEILTNVSQRVKRVFVSE